MSLYHFHVTQIGRSKGHSAVAAAAYRSGEKIYDDYYGDGDMAPACEVIGADDMDE